MRVEKLRIAIDRLVDDGTWFEHPPDLASRTVSFVARNRRRPLTLLEQVATRVPFRWADFAVAASIFVAGVLTLLPAIQRSRERMNQAGCVFNLQQLGNSLAQYATLQASLPYPPSHRSDTHAGMFAVMLHEAGVLNDLSVLDCPCNGPCPHVRQELAGFDQVDHIRRTDPELYRRMLCWDYAYNVGYRHPDRRPGAARSQRFSRACRYWPIRPTTSTLRRSATAIARTTAAAARTSCTATAAFAGWELAAPARTIPTSISTTTGRHAQACIFRTRSLFPARCRSTAQSPSAPTTESPS